MLAALLLLVEPIRVEITQPTHDTGVFEKLAAFAWPIVALVALLVLRRPIAKLLDTMGSRGGELSLGSWAAIKLPGLQETSAAQDLLSIKDVAGSMWQESGSNLIAHFTSPQTPEYAVVDLGNGDEWISSRLFIFSVMLQRMKGLRCIVFTRTTPEQTRGFLGSAAPDHVRWHLAADQPWLEAAYAYAYSGIMPMPDMLNRGSALTDAKGALQPPIAQQVVSNFIQSLKHLPPHNFPQDYVSIHSGDEHATWITPSELERIMGRDLWTDSVPENTDDSEAAKRLQVRRILDKQSPYVAQVDKGEFKSLISRVALLDEIAKRFK